MSYGSQIPQDVLDGYYIRVIIRDASSGPYPELDYSATLDRKIIDCLQEIELQRVEREKGIRNDGFMTSKREAYKKAGYDEHAGVNNAMLLLLDEFRQIIINHKTKFTDQVIDDIRKQSK